MASKRKRKTGTIHGRCLMLSMDTTTRAAYDAATTTTAKAQAVLSALTAPVYVRVYNATDNLMGEGTMGPTWGTVSGGVLTVGEVSTFTVSQSATIGAGWYLRFESGTRWVRGGFGPGQDFTWSLPTWATGQLGVLGTVTMTVPAATAENTLTAGYNVQAGTGQSPYWLGVPTSLTLTAGQTYNFAQYAYDPEGGAKTYLLVTAPSGYSIGFTTGILTAGSTSGSVVVRVTDPTGLYADTSSVAVTVQTAPTGTEYAGYTPTVVVTTASALRSALISAQAGAIIGVNYSGALTADWSEGIVAHRPVWRTANSGQSGSPIRIVARYPATLYPSNPERWTELRNGAIGGGGLYMPVFGAFNQSYVEWLGFYADSTNSPTTSDGGLSEMYNSNNCAIRYCRLIGAGALYPNDELYNGIKVSGASNTVAYNYVRNFWNPPAGSSVAANSAGIMLDRCAGGLVEHNEVDYCSAGIFHKRITAGTPGNWIVRYNYIHDVKQGIRFDSNVPALPSSYGVDIYQNLLVNVLYALGFGNSALTTTANIRFANNTVVNGAGTHDAGIYFTNQAPAAGMGHKFWNNIVSNCEHFHSNETYVTSWPTSGMDSQHNVSHGITGAFWYMDGSTYPVSTWTATGMDTVAPALNTADPLFAGGSGVAAYKLQVTSPALTQGRDLLGLSGTVGATIPAGCYITGTETIGTGY